MQNSTQIDRSRPPFDRERFSQRRAAPSPLSNVALGDDVDPYGLHIDEQFLQGRPVHRAAGKAAIIVTVPDQPPALVSLALDVCLGRLTLSVEGVEILLKPLVGRDARVDRTSQAPRPPAPGPPLHAPRSRQAPSRRCAPAARRSWRFRARDLKGIADPAPAWAALRRSSAESRFEALHASGLIDSTCTRCSLISGSRAGFPRPQNE